MSDEEIDALVDEITETAFNYRQCFLASNEQSTAARVVLDEALAKLAAIAKEKK